MVLIVRAPSCHRWPWAATRFQYGRIGGGDLKPFIKWAGGKRWLLSDPSFGLPSFSGRYIEPFLGGGAIFFHLGPSQAILSDVNERLIDTCRSIRDEWQLVQASLSEFQEKHSKEFYYEERSRQHSAPHLRAAQFLYLNRIIDGQHRIYGYANSKFKASNTIPVVAFKNLDPGDQLELFMQINENQKAVSPTLRITLEEDLYWNANRLDSRLKALRSSVIRALGGDPSGPLYNKISLGEDKAALQAKPFADALLKCKLLPEGRGNKFVDGTAAVSVYDAANVDHGDEMTKARDRAVSLINASYELAEESFIKHQDALNAYILSNRGSFAFVSLIGDLHAFESAQGTISIKSSTDERIATLDKYLFVLFKALQSISPEDAEALTGKLGSGAETTWLRIFQSYVHAKFAGYAPRLP